MRRCSDTTYYGGGGTGYGVSDGSGFGDGFGYGSSDGDGDGDGVGYGNDYVSGAPRATYEDQEGL